MTAKVVSQETLATDVYSLVLEAPEIASQAIAGQFVSVYTHDGSKMLPRPISLCGIDREAGTLRLVYRVVGFGTKEFSQLAAGDTVDILGPLGNGFIMPTGKSQKYLLVGGGVGVAPLLYFGKLIKDFGAEVTFLLGARKATDLLELDEFAKIGKVCITTEDGSAGEVGFVTNHSVLENEKFDMISTCGPKPMMVSVARFAKKAGVECEVSLENKMACGVGACLCCVEKTTEGNQCVCKDGPVINIKKLTWEI